MAQERAATQTLKALMGLRDLVLNGGVEPGERLSEVALSQKLGLSRTPLRAALSRLEQEGLLELIPSGGYAVRQFKREDVIDAIEIRGVLEGTAARLAAERGASPAQLRSIKAILDKLDLAMDTDPAKIDMERYVSLNSAFHELLWQLCGSDIVRRELERVVQLPFASPSAFLQKEESALFFRRSLVGAHQQHRAIVEAIEMREGARAEALAREHARLARRNLEFVMEHDRSLLKKVPGLALVST